jgi:type I restriction enzyme, S subunit
VEIVERYKQTELGEIPHDWRACRFEDVLIGFSSGMTPYRGRSEYYKGNIPWITSGELNYNLITDTKEKITEEAILKTNLKILPKGTFLMAITGLEAAGTRGSCGIVGVEATSNQSCMALFPIEGEITTEYLYHFYVYYGNELALKYCQGTKQQSYTGKIAKILPINLPSTISEQTSIANALSDVDALIKSLEKLISKKESIKQGAMENLLKPKDGWVTKKLGEIFEITAGGDLRVNEFAEIEDNTHCYPIYSNALSNQGLYGYSSTYDYEGNCITVTARGTVGFANYRNHEFCAIGRLLILKPKEEIECAFLSEYINHRIDFVNESTGVPQLTAPQISKYEVVIPLYAEQVRIATILSDIDEEIGVLVKKLDKYKKIKQGMMQNLLTGRIRLV